MDNDWQCWDTLPVSLSLIDDEVHVWKLDLNSAVTQLSSFYALLSLDEQERANRFRVEAPRHQFIVSRGMLRLLLSRYLQQPADRLQFRYSDRGKPELDPATLQFNLSHTEGLALYAVTRQARIGIDVEKIRSLEDVEKLSQRFLSELEYQTIANLPVELQSRQFLQYWTCREAYLKAIGEGLVGLQSLQIQALPGQTPQICLQDSTGWRIANHWSLHLLDPNPNYLVALAIKGQGYQVQCRSIPSHVLGTKDC